MSKCIGQMYMFLCGIMIDYELFVEILYRCFFKLLSVYCALCLLLFEGDYSGWIAVVCGKDSFRFIQSSRWVIIVRLLCVYCAFIVRE